MQRDEIQVGQRADVQAQDIRLNEAGVAHSSRLSQLAGAGDVYGAQVDADAVPAGIRGHEDACGLAGPAGELAVSEPICDARTANPVERADVAEMHRRLFVVEACGVFDPFQRQCQGLVRFHSLPPDQSRPEPDSELS